MASGSKHNEALFVSLDNLDSISILLDENNYSFNSVTIFVFKFEKNTTNQVLNILKTCTVIQSNFESIQIYFLV